MCDKSAIESLSKQESRLLYECFFLNVPPILALEILADLKKKQTPHSKVTGLAKKVNGMNSAVSANYRFLVSCSLNGYPITMDGRYFDVHGQPVRTRKGSIGIVRNSTPEETALLHWQSGEFSPAENVLAEAWRSASEKIPADFYPEKLRALGIPIPNRRIQSLDELKKTVANMLANPFYQENFLHWLAQSLGLSLSKVTWLIRRWRRRPARWIEDFAPYAYYCLKVELSFALGVVNKFPYFDRRTNKLDVEYCYYLPFCMVFTSGDKFLRDMAKVLLRPNQDFVWAPDLKNDLLRLGAENTPINDPRVSRFRHPPENADSLVSRLCKKHARPAAVRKAELPIESISPEELAKMPPFEEFLHSITKEIDDAEAVGRPSHEDEQQFMVRKRMVTREMLREEFPGVEF